MSLGLQRFRAVLLGMVLCSVGSTGAAFGPPTQLGLYDAAGYPYYPMDVQVFGATRAQTRALGGSVPSSESVEPVPRAVAAKASRPAVRLGFSGHQQNTVQVTQHRPHFGPMPVPGAAIMEPWAVGVFR